MNIVMFNKIKHKMKSIIDIKVVVFFGIDSWDSSVGMNSEHLLNEEIITLTKLHAGGM